MEGIFEKIGIDSGIVIIAILVAMLVLILIVLVLVARVRDITNKYTNFMRGEDGKSLERSVERRFQEVGTVVRKQTAQSSRMQFMESIQNRSLTRYGIVKYDAFDDVGGKLSFALAMLDRNDTGFVLNAIHSKENCYLYLKEVVKGQSYIMLSHEEVEALRAAQKYGSEEEAILKYQMDKAVRAEKKSENKLQEMKKSRRKPSSSNARTAASDHSRSRSMAGVPNNGNVNSQNVNSAAIAGAAAVAAGTVAAASMVNASQPQEAYAGKISPVTEEPIYTNPSGGYVSSSYVNQTSYDASSYVSPESYDASAYAAQPAYDPAGYAAQPVNDTPSYAASAGYDSPSYVSPTAGYDSGSYTNQSAGYEPASYAPQVPDAYSAPGYENQSVSAYSADAGGSQEEISEPLYQDTEVYSQEAPSLANVPIYETPAPAFVENGQAAAEENSVKAPSQTTPVKAGNRKSGQPPKKAKRNKNRKYNDRKDQGHAGH